MPAVADEIAAAAAVFSLVLGQIGPMVCRRTVKAHIKKETLIINELHDLLATHGEKMPPEVLQRCREDLKKITRQRNALVDAAESISGRLSFRNVMEARLCTKRCKIVNFVCRNASNEVLDAKIERILQAGCQLQADMNANSTSVVKSITTTTTETITYRNTTRPSGLESTADPEQVSVSDNASMASSYCGPRRDIIYVMPETLSPDLKNVLSSADLALQYLRDHATAISPGRIVYLAHRPLSFGARGHGPGDEDPKGTELADLSETSWRAHVILTTGAAIYDHVCPSFGKLDLDAATVASFEIKKHNRYHELTGDESVSNDEILAMINAATTERVDEDVLEQVTGTIWPTTTSSDPFADNCINEDRA